MDFEKEMQKSLRIIRRNIQAINGEKKPVNLSGSHENVKRRQRSVTVSAAQGTSAEFVEQESAPRERCFSF